MPLMVLLGLRVRDGAAGVDSLLEGRQGSLGGLLFFTDPRTVGAVLLAAFAVSVYRRMWALLPMIVIAPFAAAEAARAFKMLLGRFKGDALSYPSGHTTVMVVALGLLVLAVGIRRWLLWSVALFALLGMLGQGATYHYFTDTVGAVLLGTSLVCLAVLALRWAHRRTRRAVRRLGR